MQSLISGTADCSVSSNPLNGMLKRENIDRSLLRDRNAPSSSSANRPLPFRANPTAAAFSPQSRSSPGPGPSPGLVLQQQQPQQQQGGGGWASSFNPQGNVQHLHAHNQAQAQAQGQGRMGDMETAFQNALTFNQNHNHNHNQFQTSYNQRTNGWNEQYQHFSSSSQSQAVQEHMNMNGKGKEREHNIPPVPLPQPLGPPTFPQMNNGMYMNQASSSFLPSYSGMGMMQSITSNHGQAQGQAQNQRQGAEVDEAQLNSAWEEVERDFELGRADGKGVDRQKDGVEEKEKQKEEAKEGEEVLPKGGDFEAVWNSIRPESTHLDALASWEKDFSQFTNNNNPMEDELDFDLNEYMKGIEGRDEDLFRTGGMGREESGTGVRMGEDGFPVLGDYAFETENPYENSMSSLSRALDMLKSNGPLSEIALLLESTLSSRSATQQIAELDMTDDDKPGSLQAKIMVGGEAAIWTLLGMVQAMDEKEAGAVRALEEGRRRWEGLGGGRGRLGDIMMGEGLVALAISYTNESYDHSALLGLHRYLTLLHPSYAGPTPQESNLLTEDLSDENGFIPNPWQANQRLTESFLSLARDQNKAGTVDADTQVGLGVLFYQTGEFEKARDCWVAALGVRPNDFLLWNRLGATLANSGDPEQAIDAYRRALELHPTYTRAIYNLGVSCLNIGVHHEAAEHFLAGLALHETQHSRSNPNANVIDQNPANNSSALWSTLRRALEGMDRPDLVEKAIPGTDLEFFRRQGFEF